MSKDNTVLVDDAYASPSSGLSSFFLFLTSAWVAPLGSCKWFIFSMLGIGDADLFRLLAGLGGFAVGGGSGLVSMAFSLVVSSPVDSSPASARISASMSAMLSHCY